MRTHTAALVGIIIVLLACKGTTEGSKSDEPTSPKEPEMTVSAKEVQAEYKANEARADAKFKGKTIKITGTVESIDSDLMDDPVVHLVSGELLGVSLHDLSKDVAISLNKGDSVAFICVGGGEVMGSPKMNKCRKADTSSPGSATSQTPAK